MWLVQGFNLAPFRVEEDKLGKGSCKLLSVSLAMSVLLRASPRKVGCGSLCSAMRKPKARLFCGVEGERQVNFSV